jgi:hypothetical protein
MDEAGFIFAPALAPSQGFIYRGLVTLDPVGKTLLPEADFKKIEFFVQELRGLSLAPREAVFESVDYATIVLAGGGKLVINMSDDLSAVLSNISAIITDRTVTPSLSHFLSTLDYLKLDTGRKLYTKCVNKKCRNNVPAFSSLLEGRVNDDDRCICGFSVDHDWLSERCDRDDLVPYDSRILFYCGKKDGHLFDGDDAGMRLIDRIIADRPYRL